MSLNHALAEDPLAGRHAIGAAVAENDFVPDASWFAERREPFGASSLRLDIGPLEFRLEGLSESQAAKLAAGYGPFVTTRSSGDRPTSLVVRFSRAGRAGFLAVPAGRPEHYRMGRRSRDGRHDFWAYEFAATADADYGRAELALPAATGPEFDRGVENVLRVLTAHNVLTHGGLLLHGAGVVRGGAAHVFFGPSGAGKTTVTDLSPHDRVLSDDLTLVLPDGKEYRASGHPFGMAHHRAPETTESFPLAGLYRLVQSPEVRLERLDRARALGEVASCLPFVMHDAPSAARALDSAAAFLAGVPVWRLRFRRDDAFWQAIEKEGAR
ncbi:MAG TPA: hypothetical protein VGQ67_14425 [Candidatus Polarisedimenticolia bacterium]|nr:hypothetical protein [Candidatus Polarisedimenticolia bacterium]